MFNVLVTVSCLALIVLTISLMLLAIFLLQKRKLLLACLTSVMPYKDIVGRTMGPLPRRAARNMPLVTLTLLRMGRIILNIRRAVSSGSVVMQQLFPSWPHIATRVGLANSIVQGKAEALVTSIELLLSFRLSFRPNMTVLVYESGYIMQTRFGCIHGV